MKTKLLAIMLLAGGSMFAQTRFSIGIGFGGNGAGFYQPPPSYASNIPPCPGSDYIWADGYWSQNYGRNTWVAGYWNRQPFSRNQTKRATGKRSSAIGDNARKVEGG